MNIAEISANDVGELKKLARRAILESVDANDNLKDEIILDTLSHIDKNASGSDCIFLKYFENDILGFILVQDYWNLSDLYVLPESHGKGVGRSLFDAAMIQCMLRQERGYIRVNSSLNAEGFYRNIGFENFTQSKEVPNYVVPLIYNF